MNSKNVEAQPRSIVGPITMSEPKKKKQVCTALTDFDGFSRQVQVPRKKGRPLVIDVPAERDPQGDRLFQCEHCGEFLRHRKVDPLIQ